MNSWSVLGYFFEDSATELTVYVIGISAGTTNVRALRHVFFTFTAISLVIQTDRDPRITEKRMDE